jgi:hypothetical protein
MLLKMRIVSLLTGFLLVIASAASYAADAVPATAFFPVLPFDAQPDALPQLVPLAVNHALSGTQTSVTRAIIVIHDESRDANNTLAGMTALAGALNSSTLILAPQFLLTSDVARFADHLPEHGKTFAAWQMGGWMGGGDAVASSSSQKGVSSFTVIDLLLMYLADRNAFPNLKNVAIAGYGAGGEFVQRYAAFGVAAAMLGSQEITVRYVVADAPSYLYLTATRPLGGTKGLGRPDPAACPDYNAYPYGLEKMNAYVRRTGGNAAKIDYATHAIAYLNTTTPDTVTDTGCAALAQGADSVVRAANYQTYLQSLYGDLAAQTQMFALFKDAKNDAVTLYGSPCGMAFLFGDGVCAHVFGEHQ